MGPKMTRVLPMIGALVLGVIVPLQSEASSASSCIIEMSSPALKSIHSELREAQADDELIISVDAQNCSESSREFVAIVEVRNSLGITENLVLQPVTLEGNAPIQIGISWIPAYGDDYQLRAFAVSNVTLPSALSPVVVSDAQIAEHNTENLVLEFDVTKTDVSTAESYGTSYYLVNNGSRTVSLTVDGYIGAYVSANGMTPVRLGPDPSCTWKHATRIAQPDVVLRPGEMMNLTEISSVSEAPKYPGTYYISPFVILSVQAEDRVKCLEVVGNTVALNVTGPAYEGVRLVLKTDKESYTVDEDVHMSLYIENVSDEPFVLTEQDTRITIQSDNGMGTIVAGLTVDSFGPTTVEPHSIYRLDDAVPLVWDLGDVYQIPPQDDDNNVEAISGTYFISASFTYPYLESETLEISVRES